MIVLRAYYIIIEHIVLLCYPQFLYVIAKFMNGILKFPAQQCRSALHLPRGSAKLEKERIGIQRQEVEKNE